MLKKIDAFRMKIVPILPLVYDDSLSYMEILYKVMRKTNECIEDINTFEQMVLNQETRLSNVEGIVGSLKVDMDIFKEQVQAQIDELSSDLHRDFDELRDELQGEIDALVQDTNAKIDALERRLNAKFDELEAEVLARVNASLNDMRTEMDNFKTEIRRDVDLLEVRVDMMRTWVENRLEDFIADLPSTCYVKSPFTGETVNVQVAIDELYEWGSRWYACTCGEFDDLGLTAGEFDDLGLTAWEFDMWGLKKLPFKDPIHYMYSPFTGEYVPLQDVIIELSNLHRQNALTCGEYDALLLSAITYDEKEVTAYNFDWYSRDYLVA